MNRLAQLPAEPYDDTTQQEEAATLGMWAFLATEILFFGVLFAGYTVLRLLRPDAFVSGSRHTDLPLGTLETAVLLMSSFTAALSVRDIQLGGRGVACWLLVLTAALGAAFLVIHGVEYRADYRAAIIPGIRYAEVGPLAAPKQLFFLLYYITTAFHGLHVLIGIVLLAVTAVRVQRGDYTAKSHWPLEIATLYWHLVDIVWIFVFPLYYLVGRA
jgi:cytochrome c oxidase subunit 3